MSYAWISGGWDANQDGVQEGKQHNTMDVDYYGPNPQMQFWYFGALKASAAMARAMNDPVFAKQCEQVLAKGSTWVDENLFNGEYYEHKITDPKTFQFLDRSNPTTAIPNFQLGEGCLLDQVVGQYMAHVCGPGLFGQKRKHPNGFTNRDEIQFCPPLRQCVQQHAFLRDGQRIGANNGRLSPKAASKCLFRTLQNLCRALNMQRPLACCTKAKLRRAYNASKASAIGSTAKNAILLTNPNADTTTPGPWPVGRQYWP